MKIEKEFLPLIFENDLIYSVKDESEVPTYEQQELVEEKTPSQVAEPAPSLKTGTKSPAVPTKASKPVLILVDEDFSAAEDETLQKLLSAIQVKAVHYEIVRSHPESLKELGTLKLFLSFHKDFVKEDQYTLHTINTTKIIYAHNLTELNRDQQKKLMLWNLLKSMVKK
ncbi:hypothetical protein JKA74_00925 [Marivirga sp. S37H4]|uniref:Uncharacterized protein n=1 Tax=Marivirga aurantiaca TaxID=2802615 RepID=A0A934WVA1_9BACT|nr:hypothetical protein [Marivirga aurantiaca]MBK6263581.1 hypothetical protein [Marivirga aurantiaca]